MKEWFLIKEKGVSSLLGVNRPKGVQNFIWVESTKKRCRQRWPDATVIWLGNRKPVTISEGQLDFQ